jgi:hypothetical protein
LSFSATDGRRLSGVPPILLAGADEAVKGYVRPCHFREAATCAEKSREGVDALGNAAASEDRRTAGDQHPQHLLAALARLAEAGEPMLGPVQQLRRIRAISSES